MPLMEPLEQQSVSNTWGWCSAATSSAACGVLVVLIQDGSKPYPSSSWRRKVWIAGLLSATKKWIAGMENEESSKGAGTFPQNPQEWMALSIMARPRFLIAH